MDSKESFIYNLIKDYEDSSGQNDKLSVLKGSIMKLALTQTGSRFLQKQLTKANTTLVEFLLEEIGCSLCELMTDSYGNYFCQKLLLSCSGNQRLSILQNMRERIIEVCCNKKGTHTIQTMVDLVNLPEEEDFIRKALRGNIVRLSLDSQGTHVVQKVIICFGEEKR